MAYSVGWGRGVLATKCNTAPEALLIAEEHLAAGARKWSSPTLLQRASADRYAQRTCGRRCWRQEDLAGRRAIAMIGEVRNKQRAAGSRSLVSHLFHPTARVEVGYSERCHERLMQNACVQEFS